MHNRFDSTGYVCEIYDVYDMDDDACFTESTGLFTGLSMPGTGDASETEAIMHEFRGIVGYENLKNEMAQLCDIMRNRDCYDRFGARIPKGLFLYGMPGVGKTSMAEAVARASGRPVIRIRRTAAGDAFIEEIKDAFQRAATQAPSILLMDDIDKYADDSNYYGTAAEYAALQACIDNMGEEDVFLIATANNIDSLPNSLIRKGRFDRKRRVSPPGIRDAEKILRLYLPESVKTSDDLDLHELAVMAYGKSCAYIESLANDAAVLAGYERSDEIKMDHFVRAYLRWRISSLRAELSPEEKQRTAYYKAGGAVLTAVMRPQALKLMTAYPYYESNNIDCMSTAVHNEGDDPYRFGVMRALAGRAAEEVHFGDFDNQCSFDIRDAYELMLESISHGVDDYLELEQVGFREASSERLAERICDEADEAMQAYYEDALSLIKENEKFLDRTADALMEKDYLLPADIRRIQVETAILN